MIFKLKIWNQASDEKTMGIRVNDIDTLADLAKECVGPDEDGNWNNLKEYLSAAETAHTTLTPFERQVDVVWLREQPFGGHRVEYLAGDSHDCIVVRGSA